MKISLQAFDDHISIIEIDHSKALNFEVKWDLKLWLYTVYSGNLNLEFSI